MASPASTFLVSLLNLPLVTLTFSTTVKTTSLLSPFLPLSTVILSPSIFLMVPRNSSPRATPKQTRIMGAANRTLRIINSLLSSHRPVTDNVPETPDGYSWFTWDEYAISYFNKRLAAGLGDRTSRFVRFFLRLSMISLCESGEGIVARVY